MNSKPEAKGQRDQKRNQNKNKNEYEKYGKKKAIGMWNDIICKNKRKQGKFKWGNERILIKEKKN